jgi:4'-phosphopantetheinyl transferase
VSGLSAQSTAELWCVDLNAAAPALHAAELATPRLCQLDRARGSAFSDPLVRAEWTATHIALRVLIERAAGPGWRGVTLTRAGRGKPHLEGAPLAFSLSHAPGLALIGIASGGSIGVDVERSRTVRIGDARRARIEAAGAALVASSLPATGEARFLQAWVRLEAYAKADGCGIARLLTRLGILGSSALAQGDVADSGQRVASMLVDDGHPAVRDLQLGAGVHAAAVFAGVAPTIVVSWLPTSAEGIEKLIN